MYRTWAEVLILHFMIFLDNVIWTERYFHSAFDLIDRLKYSRDIVRWWCFSLNRNKYCCCVNSFIVKMMVHFPEVP